MTLAVAAVAQPGTTPPSVRLTITSSSSTAVTVQRQLPDGTTEEVRTSDGNPLSVSGTATLVDAAAPFGQQITYIANGAAVSNAVVVNADRPWLVHLGYPDRSVPVAIARIDARDRDVTQGVFWPMGGKYPIVVTDGTRRAPASTLTVRTTGLAAEAALERILADASTLLLNIPASRQWGVTYEYVAIGKVSEANPAGWGGYPDRLWDLPYQVVQAPVGGTVGVGGGIGVPGSGNSGGGAGGGSGSGTRTWGDLAAELQAELGRTPTWADAAAKYPTWAAAAAGGS